MPQLHTWVLSSLAKGICHMWGLLGCGDLFLPTSPPAPGPFFCLCTERTFPPSAPWPLPMQTRCMRLVKAPIPQSTAPMSSCPPVLIPQKMTHGAVKWVS